MLYQNRKIITITFTTAIIAMAHLGNVAYSEGYKFPPSDVTTQTQQVPAASDVQVTRPAVNTQPVATRYNRPAYYPAQRPAPYGVQSPYGMQTPYGVQKTRMPMQQPMQRTPMQAPSRPPMYAYPRQAPSYARPGTAPYYGMPYNNRPAYTNSYRPYNNPYSSPYNNPYNNPYRPYNQRSSNNNQGPFNQFGGGPFNGNNPPWEEWPFGAPDSFWSRKEFPFKEQSPVDWVKPGDPKEGMAIMWDDLISAPDDLGTMPGGWAVPSVRVPNPVDLEDQLEKASKEIPDLIRIYSE